MSYILDALRRAESERDRERGVPGLNAQPVPVGSLLGMPSRRNRAAVWVVLGLALGLAVPLGWRWMTSDDADVSDPRLAASGSVVPAAPVTLPPPAPPEDPRAVRPPVGLSAPATSANPGTQAVPPQPAVRPRDAGASAAAPGPTAPPLPRAAAAPAERGVAMAPPRPRSTTDAPRAEPAAPTKRAAAAPPPPAAAAPVQKLSDLPEDLRRQVPTLAFGGSVYSALPAQRMVIFNGQVLREGDPVADGLTVEEIRAKSAVLRLRGQRFEVVF